jgi:pimeloyl-ACP methyl ester carboxylesterase
MPVDDAGSIVPAIVCLHAGIADRRMWRPQRPEVYGRRIVAFDRRGFGDAVIEAGPAGPEPWSAVDDTLAVMDALGLGRAVLLGCSQGGRVALDLALERPERVAALILVAPAVSGAPSSDDGLDPALITAWAEAERSRDIDRLNALEVRLWLDGPEAPEGRVQGPVRDLVLDMNGRALRAAPVGEPTFRDDTWARLESIDIPALVVWGTLDVPDVVARCAELVQRLPRAEGVALDGLAHLPSLEAPERFDPVAVEFLARALTG